MLLGAKAPNPSNSKRTPPPSLVERDTPPPVRDVVRKAQGTHADGRRGYRGRGERDGESGGGGVTLGGKGKKGGGIPEKGLFAHDTWPSLAEPLEMRGECALLYSEALNLLALLVQKYKY